ncbi:hypothetical protein ER308_15010 [Egibacter rhizosphaerae]|uniref:receptor protein-tyrosine kinase n=1 Tax=Egibacter rhizosphaerae TaxID=1670831 RepID=A0A411YI39_9ACTN|nr:cell wall-binding repeat-containing protein [Egibacter rhizosphaerae]QBI20742.1 hypothetical protein ER308_15010 [Egibacter rhizosphaerae]
MSYPRLAARALLPRRALAVLLVLVLVASLVAVPPSTPATAADTVGVTFGLEGAGGGNEGGSGGWAAGTAELDIGDEFTVVVGGAGDQQAQSPGDSGFNGGGDARLQGDYAGGPIGTGGGATDVRLDGDGLDERVLVAGGGGGGASDWNTSASGGDGGGEEGEGGSASYATGGGGTQGDGGEGEASCGEYCPDGPPDGVFDDGDPGQGGDVDVQTGGSYAAGGGGGWHGGGGAGEQYPSDDYGVAGGGGSGHIDDDVISDGSMETGGGAGAASDGSATVTLVYPGGAEQTETFGQGEHTVALGEAPDAPTIDDAGLGEVTTDEATIDVAWTEPSDTGDEGVTSYRVEIHHAGDAPGDAEPLAETQPDEDADSASLTVEEAGELEAFVRAESGIAPGDWDSAAVGDVALCPTAPVDPAVDDVAWDQEQREATVSWEPPESDGGDDLLEYVVTSGEASTTVGAGTHAATVAVAAGGDTVEIEAVNDVVTGEAAATTVDALDAPGSDLDPIDATPEPTDGAVDVHLDWSEPSDWGDGESAPAGHYRVERDGQTLADDVDATATTVEIGETDLGDTHPVEVFAVGIQGDDGAAVPTDASFGGAPDAPTGLAVTDAPAWDVDADAYTVPLAWDAYEPPQDLPTGTELVATSDGEEVARAGEDDTGATAVLPSDPLESEEVELRAVNPSAESAPATAHLSDPDAPEAPDVVVTDQEVVDDGEQVQATVELSWDGQQAPVDALEVVDSDDGAVLAVHDDPAGDAGEAGLVTATLTADATAFRDAQLADRPAVEVRLVATGAVEGAVAVVQAQELEGPDIVAEIDRTASQLVVDAAATSAVILDEVTVVGEALDGDATIDEVATDPGDEAVFDLAGEGALWELEVTVETAAGQTTSTTVVGLTGTPPEPEIEAAVNEPASPRYHVTVDAPTHYYADAVADAVDPVAVLVTLEHPDDEDPVDEAVLDAVEAPETVALDTGEVDPEQLEAQAVAVWTDPAAGDTVDSEPAGTNVVERSANVGPTIEVNADGDEPRADVPAAAGCWTGAETSDGQPECTLRAAIEFANATADADLDPVQEIVLPAGATIVPDEALELDVEQEVTVTGDERDVAEVVLADGDLTAAAGVTLDRLDVTDGVITSGGAVATTGVVLTNTHLMADEDLTLERSSATDGSVTGTHVDLTGSAVVDADVSAERVTVAASTVRGGAVHAEQTIVSGTTLDGWELPDDPNATVAIAGSIVALTGCGAAEVTDEGGNARLGGNCADGLDGPTVDIGNLVPVDAEANAADGLFRRGEALAPDPDAVDHGSFDDLFDRADSETCPNRDQLGNPPAGWDCDSGAVETGLADRGQDAGTVEVTVLDPSGESADGASVTFTDTGSGDHRVTHHAEPGADHPLISTLSVAPASVPPSVTAELPPGEVDLRLQADGLASSRDSAVVPSGGGTTSTEAQLSRPTRPSPTELQVTVTDAGEALVAGAEVVVDDGALAGTTDEEGLVAWSSSDEDVPTGDVVEIAVTADGHRDATVTEAVEARATTAVEVALDPAGTERIAGGDRVETAAEVALEAHPDGSDTAVVATGAEPADSLAAGPLAAAADAPLLLTRGDELPAATSEALEALGVTQVLVVGGPDAVAGSVEAALGGGGVTVDRIAGQDRFDTAARVAEEVTARGGATGRALLAASDPAAPERGWPDALAAASYAGIDATPILLTRADDVPDATREAADGRTVEVVGGPTVVSDDATAGLDVARRLAGADRWGTTVAVLDAAIAVGADPDQAWIATGRDWPDGLTAGAAAAATGGVLVLVDGGDLDASAATREWLTDHAPDRLRITGGSEIVTPTVVEALSGREP